MQNEMEDSDNEDGIEIHVMSKPASHYDASAMKAGTTNSEFDASTDPLIKKQKFMYENPRDIAHDMRINDIDVARLAKLQNELSNLLKKQSVYKQEIHDIEKELLELSEDNDDEDVLSAKHDALGELVKKNTMHNKEVKALRYDIENLACTVGEKALSRAFAAAEANDTEKLSEAQIACFKQKLMLNNMEVVETLNQVQRDLSPFANWMNYMTLALDECFGVFTHHTQALFVIAAGKSAFIADDVMRTHTLQSGPPEAGKDFIRETAQQLSPPGVYQTRSSTTEAARVDKDRRLETGIVFCYSETRLSESASNQYAGRLSTSKNIYGTFDSKKSFCRILMKRGKRCFVHKFVY